MKLKPSFVLFCLIFSTLNLFAINVIVVKEPIKYKERISIKKLKFMQVDKINKKCKPVTLNYINNKKFIAAHYLNKGAILCEHNLKTYKKNSIVFDFGNIEIEKNGKVIRDTDDFIMLKNENGKRDKIFKDGRMR